MPAKLFCGIIGTNMELITEVCEHLVSEFGLLDAQSEAIPFNFTDYYKAEMGDNLIRIFISFFHLIDPSTIADIKIATNSLEDKFVADTRTMARRINIDPGYITASKVVLATTKDFAHRVSIGKGIYAEVTFNFMKDGFKFFDWTYPDFKSGKYDSFFLETRNMFMEQYRTDRHEHYK